MPPTYRDRLRREGAVLAGAGALASIGLLIGIDAATDRALSTALQLAAVTVLLLVAGPLAVRRWIAQAQQVQDGAAVSGNPTALWLPPLVVVVLAGAFVAIGAGWDAGLRVTLGCVLVGLAQSVLLERLVAADEQRTGRRYVRLPGSRAILGTKLGFFSNRRV